MTLQFDVSDLERVVNVASVKQRSPFRYPGGKTWLAPRVRRWLASLPQAPARLIEPFAGGAIVGLTAAAEQLAGRVILVELDEDVAAVWQTILYGDARWLVDRILAFQLDADHVGAALAESPQTTPERAFQTILRNRVLHGGILAPGSGLLKRGENGKGLASRWYPETLGRRILDIAKMRERLTFVQGDGLAVMQQYQEDRAAAFFIDPPYTAAGKRAGRRLYRHFDLDHARLFEIAQGLAGDVLITYDQAPEISDMAHRRGFQVRAVAMSNTHHAAMQELLIGRNLDWC